VVETWDSYDQLSLMRQSTEQELRLARSIQQASLPKEVPTLEGWQISPYYQQERWEEISTTSILSRRASLVSW
jgi:serine phosphatase RsbU (regulator of sigma subunit)